MRRFVAISWVLLVAGWMLGWSSAAHALSTGFIENRGQVNEGVRYYLPGSGAAVYFTPQAVVVDLKERVAMGDRQGPRFGPELADSASVPQTQHGCAVYIRFEGASPSPRIEARGELVTRYNYFLGNDPARWHAGVRAFEEVVYHGLWPGLDVVFRLDRAAIAYEVQLAPGADAAQVRFSYQGADSVLSLAGGCVRIETRAGALFHVGPGPAGGGGELRLASQAEADQLASELLDEPEALLWSTFLGGSDSDYGRALTLDSAGNPVTTGYTTSSSFPTTPGAHDPSFNGSCDVFVAKLVPCPSGRDFPDCRTVEIVGELFGARFSEDASGIPPGDPFVFDSTLVTVTRADSDSIYVSGRPDSLAPWICAHGLYVNGVQVSTGHGSLLDPTLPLCRPLETIYAPVPARNVTRRIPMGTNCSTFQLVDTDREILGNTKLYLIRVPGGHTAVPQSGTVSATPGVLAAPNPSSQTIRFRIAGAGGPGTVEIYDAAGRRVRAFPRVTFLAQPTEFTWDTRDDAGRPVQPGVYFYQVSIGRQTHTGKLVVAR